MAPSSAEAIPSTGFARAFALLKEATDPNLEVYLISDFQGDAWRNFEFGLFETERMDVKLFVTSTSGTDIDNVEAEKVTFPKSDNHLRAGIYSSRRNPQSED